jgi:hypothetical protein
MAVQIEIAKNMRLIQSRVEKYGVGDLWEMFDAISRC